MNLWPSPTHCFSIVFTAVMFLRFSSTPAHAFPPTGLPDGDGKSCNRPPCSGQRLGGDSEVIITSPLTVDFDFANSDQFVTDIEGASSNPNDIVQLVDDAVTVWRSAFEDLPNINLGVGWADFGLGSNVIGTHSYNSDLNETTILFNNFDSQFGKADEQFGDIKLFLDTNPFNSSAFGSLEDIGAAKQSTIFTDSTVADLFTVALHEVGHALGFPRESQVPSDIRTNDLNVLGDPLSFGTRKCPTESDVRAIARVGSYVPDAPDYVIKSTSPCNSDFVSKADPTTAKSVPEHSGPLAFVLMGGLGLWTKRKLFR